MPDEPRRRTPRPVRSAVRTGCLAVALLALVTAGCSKADDATPPGTTTTPTTGPTSSAPRGTTVATGAPTTVAPSTTVAPTSTPVKGPPIDTRIRDVDFGEQVLPSDSCGPVFAAPPVGGYGLRGGEARQGSPGDADFYAIAVRPDPAYGDLTGDGREDAVIIVDCSTGTAPISFAWVFGAGPGAGTTQREGGLTLDTATRTRLDSFGEPRLTGIDLEGSTVATTWATHQPGDPICCPTGQATVTFTWSGSGFTPST